MRQLFFVPRHEPPHLAKRVPRRAPARTTYVRPSNELLWHRVRGLDERPHSSLWSAEVTSPLPDTVTSNCAVGGGGGTGGGGTSETMTAVEASTTSRQWSTHPVGAPRESHPVHAPPHTPAF